MVSTNQIHELQYQQNVCYKGYKHKRQPFLRALIVLRLYFLIQTKFYQHKVIVQLWFVGIWRRIQRNYKSCKSVRLRDVVKLQPDFTSQRHQSQQPLRYCQCRHRCYWCSRSGSCLYRSSLFRHRTGKLSSSKHLMKCNKWVDAYSVSGSIHNMS